MFMNSNKLKDSLYKILLDSYKNNVKILAIKGIYRLFGFLSI